MKAVPSLAATNCSTHLTDCAYRDHPPDRVSGVTGTLSTHAESFPSVPIADSRRNQTRNQKLQALMPGSAVSEKTVRGRLRMFVFDSRSARTVTSLPSSHARSPTTCAGVPRYHQTPEFCSMNSITSITLKPGRSRRLAGANRQWNGERETPMTAVEIAALICERAGIDKMGVDDDFFRVGGKSWERWC